MSATPQETLRKGEAFRALHERPRAFVVPNPWDAGSARLLAAQGFEALATTSAGLAFAAGRPDGANRLSREESLANAAAIAAATALPVTADLESGFGERPEEVAETFRLAAAAGLVGGSIEDATGRPDEPVAPIGAAAERVAAAVEAARAAPFPFTVTARAENFLYGRPDLADTIARLRAYQDAGADVLYAPGLPSAQALREVCASVGRPVNVLAAGPLLALSADELESCGARRISLGSALVRAALAALLEGAAEITGKRTFSFAERALPYAEANRMLS